MSDSLNNKELVLVGHDFAKALSSDTPIIDIAKMLSHLATRLDCTTAALQAMYDENGKLSAESSGLKGALNKIAFTYPLSPHIHEMTTIQTRATDAFLAEVRAQGVESVGEYLKQYAQGLHEGARFVLQDVGELCNGFAAQLRKGGE